MKTKASLIKAAREILAIIRDHPEIVRSQVARMTGMSKSTAERGAQLLVDAKLVVEKQEAGDRRGRGGIRLAINPATPCAIGIDLGASHIAMAAVNLRGELLRSASVQIHADMEREEIFTAFEPGLALLIKHIQNNGGELLGIGFGDPGIVDARKGISLGASNLPRWCNVPIVARLNERFGVRVKLQGAARIKCLGEARYGIARGARGFLLVDMGVGIGLGIYTHGQLYEGEQGRGCEFGHTVVAPGGPVCSCGGRGCLEAIAGCQAMIRQFRHALANGAQSSLAANAEDLSMPDILAASAAGDRLTRGIVEEAANVLGVAIGNLCNIFNPELVVLGGGLAKDKGILPPIEAAIRKTALPAIGEQLRVSPTSLPDTGALLGAAELVFQEYMMNWVPA